MAGTRLTIALFATFLSGCTPTYSAPPRENPTHQARLDELLGGSKGHAELDAYRATITTKIRRNLIRPPELSGNYEAVFEVEQIKTASGGQIVNVKLKQSSGNRTLDDAIERAIHKSDPLPLPNNPALFRRKLVITFRPLEN
ncbi:MAG: TonB C-terminal domain-containing protein [Azoarcus sp.]|jgi:colicin import membrane protein|nr:TonB C-terminal domain-containing protein [Azoarcus sp.]